METISMKMNEPSKIMLDDIGRVCSPKPIDGTGFFSQGSYGSSKSSSHRHGFRRRNGGHMRTRSSFVSKELSTQAESEFFALMELMSSIDRRSISLKEVWTKLISERESYMAEIDRMYEQIEEYSEAIELKEKEQRHQHHNHEERNKETINLRLEIKAAVTTVAEYKTKLAEQCHEFERVRRELCENKESIIRVCEEHEDTKKVLDETQLKLVCYETERDDARKDAEKYHCDFRSLNQRYSQLQNTYTEISEKCEISHKELLSIRESFSVLKSEKHEWLHERGEFCENLRKANHKCDEIAFKLDEMTKKYEKKARETHKLNESISTIQYEKEELHQRVEELKVKIDEKHCKWEEAEDECGKWKLKCEHSDRDLCCLRDEIRALEIVKSDMHHTNAKIREEMRILTIEKERVCEDYYAECKKYEECHRKTIILQESLRRIESTLKEKTETINTLTARVQHFERERNEACNKSGHLSVRIEQLQTNIVTLKAEVVTLTKHHDNAREKLRECEARYEEVCESVTEYQGGSSEYEYEITTLRNMLREAREQKEKAISARHAADLERDAANTRYEEKCRELERYEEQMAQHFHSQGKAETRRVFTRNFRKASDEGTCVGSYD